jgi:MinD-like ATPase involved in chromosome partitioning or flagellar assembly
VTFLGKIIAVHSYKGGTGKTLLSVNLAATFAKHGKKVCLMDLDFRAPSISTILKVEKAECWLNDYLNGACEIDKVLVDLSDRFQISGEFFVGAANPKTEAIRDMSAKDRKWEMRALGRMLALRTSLINDKGFDYLIFDTSPGLQYSSINAIVSADLVLVATTFDRSDVDGTKRMLRELYDLFEKKTGIVLNKVLYDFSSRSGKEELQAKINDAYRVPLLGAIPCFCDISKAEGNFIFALERPQHPFAKILDEIAYKIESNMS